MKLERTRMVMEKVLEAGLLSSALTPFVLTTSLIYPAVTGKALYLRAIAVGLLVLWLVGCALFRSWRPRWAPLTAALVAFIGWVALADLLSPDPATAFWGSFERSEGLVGILTLGGLFVVASSVLRRSSARRHLLWAWSGSLGLLAFVGLAEYGWAVSRGSLGHRIQASLGNPAYFASCLLIAVFLVGALLGQERQRGRRRLLIGIGWILLAALVFTGTRGAFIGLGVGAAVAAIVILGARVAQGHERRGALQVLGCVGAIVLTIGIAQGLALLGDSGGESPLESGIEVTDASDKSSGVLHRISSPSGLAVRLDLWEVAVRGVAEAPVFGHGHESFEAVVDQHFRPDLRYAVRWDKPHNAILDWAVIGGLPAAILYLVVFLTAAAIALRARAPVALRTRASLVGLLAAYLVSTFFLFDTPTSYAMIFGVLACIQGLYSDESSAKDDTKGGGLAQAEGEARRELSAVRAPWALAALVVLGAGAVAVLIPFHSAVALGAAYDLATEGDSPRVVAALERALDFAGFAPAGIEEGVYKTAMRAHDASRLRASFDRESNFAEIGPAARLALEVARAEVKAAPGDVRARAMLGKLLASFGQQQLAVEQFRAAIDLLPQDPSLLGDLATSLIEIGDRASREEAYELAVRAGEMSEWQRRPTEIFAIAAIATGRLQQGRRAYQLIYQGGAAPLRRAKVENAVADALRRWGEGPSSSGPGEG